MGFRLREPLEFSVKVPCWNWRIDLGQSGLVAGEGLACVVACGVGRGDTRLETAR